jgi:hypothetical protein
MLLSKPDSQCTPGELEAKHVTLTGYQAIKDHPFQPHVVARTRTVAYQYHVVMKYLDNLIDWGDSLFMQDTIETINEATQCYVLAANILGPRPEVVPTPGTVRPRTFADLKKIGMDVMGNALVDLEGKFPFNFVAPGTGGGGGDTGDALFGVGRTLYFAVPRNKKLLGYWDLVSDRLFKIRHCMNIEGVVRQLALFDPPIDPGMLVKAAAAGIDVGSIVSGLNQPLSPVRAPLLMQKAIELCSEVRALGSALLNAVEKGDGERLALLRQSHEIKIHQLTQDVRFLQWKQSQQSTQALLRTRASALERYRYYMRLFGASVDTTAVPDTFPTDGRELTEETFDEAYSALVEQYDKTVPTREYARLALAGGSSPSGQSGASGAGDLYLNANEDAELNQHLPASRDFRLAASAGEVLASVLTFIPEFNIDLHFWGLGGNSGIFGGSKLSDATKIVAEILRTKATWEQDQAGMAGRTAGHQRRADDWTLQANLAARELMQIGRQIITSLVTEQIAHHEYMNVKAQISNAREVDEFLHQKFSNQELYQWMQGEIARLYYQYYRFAFDTARKAERTMKHDLMRPEVDATDYIQFNYWDGGRKGLLSGEALYLDVKRMELAYHENNKREFELTRHVSLRQLDPIALLNLKTTGVCEVTIPEWLYDRDCPGHYMRRLKNVAVSIPSVVGPYTSLNCTLTLLRSSVRTSTMTEDAGQYMRTGMNDERFTDYFGSVQQIVTSGGTNDAGMFETNLRDERYLPFEGAGAISSWRVELPKEFRPFDYSTISDVILHVRYTARQGGDALRPQVVTELRDMFSTANASGLAMLFSLRHDFPTEWAAFANGTADFATTIRRNFFPYMVQNETLSADAIELYAAVNGKLAKRTIAVPPAMSDDLNDAAAESALTVAPDASVLKRTAADVFLVVRYSIA